ncbi:MAG: SDR family NAD(P)-dependent oxidoreductase [Sulfurimicrobium sp.]|jgi:NAD(P)-dependent dehydrogenase (short-subunit alcohol dehydrogenase family)|nr:SDR family NAD(P)-dependent oxidoreductase [Sulfurimicrobium sp.]MDZ7654461.1 SDR family NAD(P)-dependent oxidoreductase [Sulfurimicrobium sp.]
MDKKSILITGCSSGIGLCVAEGLQKRGYRVFATARKTADVEMLAERGLESLQLDVADPASIRCAVDEVLRRTGGTLYALFNNAGYGQPGAVEDLRREVLREQFETNVFGTVDLTNRLIPVMRAQGGGRIIINSSLLGYVSLPFRGAYNATKYALEGIADTLRLELRGSGIHVSLVEPGPIASRFRANAHEMFRRHVEAESSFFRNTYRAMESRLAKPGPVAPFTLPPEAVLEKVIHILESSRPRIRYPVTFPAYLFAMLKRLLPGSALDRVLGRVGEVENK